MPPVPPRRKAPPLLAPRDVTETARQGQGIGDLEAMRQMATTAIPEVLRNAPVTSTPMSVFDMAKAVADRDLPAAGMAALGAIPFAGMLRYADEAAKAARALPMDEASRMARAAEQGFTAPVYHATSRAQPVEALLPNSMTGGNTGHVLDLDAVHVGTKLQANERLADLFLLGRRKNTQFQSAKKANVPRGWSNERLENAVEAGLLTSQRAPSVYPLLMKQGSQFINKAENRPFTEDELVALIKQFAKEKDITYTQGQRQFKQQLLEDGYDTVPYVNSVEGQGQVSHMVLKPENLRSRFAAFDPANIGKAGLMGGLAAVLGGAAMRQPTTTSER